MFQLFSPNKTDKFFNPKFNNQFIFTLYDSVHIAKNFRNNWINKKDYDKTFYYPKFNDFKKTCKAFFTHLRDLYSSEKNQVIRKAYKLNSKTLYPTSFERQKVLLLINILHDSTIAA